MCLARSMVQRDSYSALAPGPLMRGASVAGRSVTDGRIQYCIAFPDQPLISHTSMMLNFAIWISGERAVQLLCQRRFKEFPLKSDMVLFSYTGDVKVIIK